jgi:hypothetical protein
MPVRADVVRPLAPLAFMRCTVGPPEQSVNATFFDPTNDYWASPAFVDQ